MNSNFQFIASECLGIIGIQNEIEVSKMHNSEFPLPPIISIKYKNWNQEKILLKRELN